MTKYKRKPITVEAFQWTGVYDAKATPKWLDAAMKKEGSAPGAARLINGDTFKIVHESGILTARKGDFLILGQNGEIYPCKAAVFHLLHEEAGE